MQLPAVPPQDWGDLTLNFESLQSLLSKPSGQALAFLQLLTAKDVAVTFGTGTVTFAASTSSAVTTISHGLGRTPVWVGATNSANNGVWFASTNKTTTTVQIGGWFFTATTGTFNFDWVAIG